MRAILAAPNPALHSVALQVIDDAMPIDAKTHGTGAVPYLTDLLGGSDSYFARQSALYAAGKPRDPHLRAKLLGMLQSSNSWPDMQFLTDDLWQMGARLDTLNVLIARTSDHQSAWAAEQAFYMLTDQTHNCRVAAIELTQIDFYKTKWRAFINKHRSSIIGYWQDV